MRKVFRWVRIAVFLLLVIVVAALVFASVMRERRPDIAALGWPYAQPDESGAGTVSVTWFGISTLLFDDGETQILIDGTFTRIDWLNILLMQKVSSDIANINHALARYRINRLAAIVPIHSHFDHAMDAGHVANRTSAVILGSESTANIARGADVPVNQYQILADGESRQFGQFTITLVASRHAPIGPGDRSWFTGNIEHPLLQPARVMNWREGVVYSVVVSHPLGTTLVQGSGGFVKDKLANYDADVVMLGIGGLSRLGKSYFDEYWKETVVVTGADRVLPIHYDDFTEPFGELQLFPYAIDDATTIAGWADEQAAKDVAPVSIELMPLGVSVVLY